jgi:hypothetical protein
MKGASVETSEVSPNDLQVLTDILSLLKKLDRENQKRLLETVATFLEIGHSGKIHPQPSQLPSPGKHPSPLGRFAGGFSEDRTISPKDFLADKKPQTDVEKVACLAYYLTHYRNLPHFQTVDISKLNTEAAQTKLSNAAYAINNAVQGRYLVPAPQGKKQLSAAGERFIQALPDREAAKSAMADARPRRTAKKPNIKSSEG